MLVGFLRPAVYLPLDVDFNALPYILAHEARHGKCGDILYQYVMLAAQSIHWFNPLVHVMSRVSRRDMELACDAAVLGGRETAYRQAYGAAVLSTIANTRARALTTCFGGSAKSIKARFTAMFDSAKKHKCTALLAALLACVIFASTLVACNAKSVAEPSSAASSVAESTASSIVTAGFWDNSVIIGDSIAQGFSIYDWDGKETVKFCTYTGVAAQDILDNAERQNENGEKVKMLDDVTAKIKDAAKVVVMLGVNSAVKDDAEATAAQTGKLVEYIKQTAPNAEVVVCLASNVTVTAMSVNTAQVSKYNYYLAQWCEENGIAIKIFPNELNDEYSHLEEAYAAIDGYHFKDGTAYKLWAAVLEGADISSMMEKEETDTLLWAIPSYYTLSKDFGATNDGIDVPAPAGTPEFAVADGVVISPESDWSLGTVVTINIGNEMTAQYGNLSARSVSEGQIVKRGDIVGYVGSTGNSTGNHLHFTLTKDGTAVDPKPYFSEKLQAKLEYQK
ncbi:MAG: peptidoglycan DD-metalloendopeptidase family protein [Ruminococcaceae bacterium]|nr:peptidoglycan DD-metalloendopeptidase family protein [Oscillospiraceae bacterium]